VLRHCCFFPVVPVSSLLLRSHPVDFLGCGIIFDRTEVDRQMTAAAAETRVCQNSRRTAGAVVPCQGTTVVAVVTLRTALERAASRVPFLSHLFPLKREFFFSLWQRRRSRKRQFVRFDIPVASSAAAAARTAAAAAAQWDLRVHQAAAAQSLNLAGATFSVPCKILRTFSRGGGGSGDDTPEVQNCFNRWH
jgi:hypothetical protein